MPAITINGKVYSHPDEVPPELRESYMKALEFLHDADGNGIPDFLEGKPLASIPSGNITFEVEKPTLIAGGKVYENLDDLPPEARMKYDQAMIQLGKLMPDKNRNGIPDMLENRGAPILNDRQASSSQIPSPDSLPSVFQDETPKFGRAALVIFLIIFVLLLIGFAGYFLVSGLIK